MDVFDLVAKITLDRSQYDEGVKDAGGKFKAFGANLKKGLGTAAKIGGAAIATVGAAGAALTKAVLDGASKTAAYGDNIDKMSQKMGISAQAYQEWDAILQHSGSSIDGMQRGMMTLASAAEKNSDAFKKLGISEADLANMNQEDLFAAVIKGLQGMGEGTERAVLAQELLGGAAKELGPLLNTSAEDTEAMRQKVHELGGVMSDEAVKSAAAYQDALQDMNTALSGIKRNLSSGFLPSITKIMNGITELFSGDSEKGLGAVSEGINEMMTRITEKLPEITETGGKIVGALIEAAIQNLPQMLEAGGKIVGQLASGLASALPSLIKKAPEIIMAVVNGLKSAWPDIKAAGIAILNAVYQGIKTYAPILKQKMPEIWEGIKQTAAAAWEALKATAADMWGGIKDSIATAIEPLKNKLGTIWDGIKTKISSAIESIKGKVEGLKAKFESLKTKVQTIADKIKNVFDFQFTMPKIKLPHFKVNPEGWQLGDLLKGEIPTLSVEWYRKAYDDPYMFTKPTLFGFGDGNGGEIVYGRDNLMRDIQKAMGDISNVTINVYPRADQNEKQIAEEVQKLFIQWSRQRRAAKA